MRHISYDCRYFLGDRPCRFHKLEGALCECEHYAQTQGDILIIKLDAVGDVLRTTCLLPVIEKAWPGQRITWITRDSAAPLLKHNPYLNEVIPYGPDALVQLAARRFDKVINLDAGKTSASLAAMARGEEKIGFVLSPAGHVQATNEAAEEWLRMGVFDDLKKENTRTYQHLMCDILGLPVEGLRYILELDAVEIRQARRRLQELGMNPDVSTLGIHTGGGGRWKLKQWHPERFIELIRRLQSEQGNALQIVLFGGPLEKDLNQGIVRDLGGSIFDAGCDNTLREFAALVDQCDLMLSGDSLAMHVALARGLYTVVLFGPTSYHEIELFGLGEKVVPDLECLVCYKTECDFVPNCMDLISVEKVLEEVRRASFEVRS